MQLGRDNVFFNDTATTEIYTLSLHDALPISGAKPPYPPFVPVGSGRCGSVRERSVRWSRGDRRRGGRTPRGSSHAGPSDRKSTRLNSSHANISYAAFCLKKKK